MPIRDPHGAVLKWYGTCTDIDDLKQAADRLAGVVDDFDDACVVLDGELSVAYLNAAAEGLLGHPRRDVIGKSFAHVFPEAGDSGLMGRVREAARERRALSFQAPIGQAQRKDLYAVRVFLTRAELPSSAARAAATACPAAGKGKAMTGGRSHDGPGKAVGRRASPAAEERVEKRKARGGPMPRRTLGGCCTSSRFTRSSWRCRTKSC